MTIKRGAEVESLAHDVRVEEALRVEAEPHGTGRATMLRRATLVLVAVGSLYASVYFALGADPMAWAVLVGVLLGMANLGLLKLSGRTRLCGHIGVAILFGVLVATSYYAGGLLTSDFSWLYLVPLVAAFLIGLRAAWAWVAVVGSTSLLFWYLELGSGSSSIPSSALELHALQNHLAVSVALALLATVFLRSLRRAQARLKASNHWLVREVERRSEIESDLRESEARFRDLIENSPALLCTHDRNGVISSANRSLTRFMGYESSRELVGQSVERFLVPTVRTEFGEYLEKMVCGGVVKGMARVRTKRGEYRLLQYENALRTTAGGDEVSVQARDVTEQERARKALLRQVEQEELVSAVATRFIAVDGESLQPAIESALAELAGFAEVDRGVLRLVDEKTGQFCESFEWCQQGVPTRQPCTADGLSDFPSLGGRLQLLETVIINDVGASSEDERGELRTLLGKDVKSAVIVPLVGREGLLGFLALVSLRRTRHWMHDNLVLAYIAGYVFASAILRARNEERALRLEAEVQQARRMESLGVVAAGIAHDFNNHLMAILGNAGLVQSQLPEGSEVWRAAEQVADSARRAAQLTGQMLSFSGSANLVLERLPLNDLVRGLTQGEDMPSGHSGMLDTELEAGAPEVEVDRGQMRQVIRSLVTNAVEAMGGRPGSIRIRSGQTRLGQEPAAGVFRPLRREPEDKVYGFFEVTDGGPGIDRENLPRIFEPFFTTRFQGRGLGLAAVLGIVRAHQGIIEVDTAFGRGTTVRVLLPASGEARPDRAAAGVSASRGAVLVVDDEASVVDITARMLELSGFEVLMAGEERAAIDLLRANGHDLEAVLLDFSLGGGDPREVYRRLRSAEPKAPIIVMSGYPREELERRLSDLDVAGFVEKPFDSGVLISEIERVLGQ